MTTLYYDLRQLLVDYLEKAEDCRDIGNMAQYHEYQLKAVENMLMLRRMYSWKIRDEQDRYILMACNAIEYYFSKENKV